ncbi:MAG TPA: winged helix-turn-helix domain-containing protein [Candidatus Sulfotelmatobacter sp.]|jgi:DNA-binding winged helix-turn-helix (wHTH) protein/tetratricopeptide (TPR) repeat protein
MPDFMPDERRQTLYRFGLFSLDPANRVLMRGGVRVKVQDQPFQLLVLLLEGSGDIVSKDEIRRRLWPENTFVEFDKSLGVALVKAREALGDTASNPRFIETVPRRGYRFVAPVHIENAEPEFAGPKPAKAPELRQNRGWFRLAGLLAIPLAIIVALVLWFSRSATPASEHASVVIGDFANSTGDPVFDGSLRQAVIIHLSQSPYLNVVPDQTLKQSMQELGHSPDEALTPALARQVCQRLGSTALIMGSIQPGAHYSLSMEAQRCSDAAPLMQQTLSVDRKEEVLGRLSAAADDLRRRLGESPQSLARFDVPMELATTSSLEALKAYQLGIDLRAHSRNVEARGVLKTAIDLDPNFAIAYAQLGSAYSNLGDAAYAKQYFQKAFELRSHATEPERLLITARYFDVATAEREQGAETFKLWTELYPNDWRGYNGVANDSILLGRYETAVDFARKAVELGPHQDFGSTNLIAALIALNRLDEAKKICEQLLAKGKDNGFIHLDLFAIGTLQNDPAAIEQQLSWAGKHPDDTGMSFARASAAASEGRIEPATKLFDQTSEVQIRSGDSEAAAITLAVSAEINSEVGRSSIAAAKSERALKLGKNEMVYGLTALVALRNHEVQRARTLLEQMDHDRPLSTFNVGIYSPIIRTFIAISGGASAEELTKLMDPALPYEFGSLADMLPIYARGEAYLAVNAPAQAAVEFQKIINHRSVDAFTTLYPLSVLGMARCYRMQGKKSESVEAYQKFAALWKNADRELPILIGAHKEFMPAN